MITIEHLEVIFDAKQARDEVVFGHLFARHIALHEQARSRSATQADEAAADRSLTSRGDW